MGVDEAHVVVAVLRGEAPGAAARLAGVEDFYPFGLFDAVKLGNYFLSDVFVYVHRAILAVFWFGGNPRVLFDKVYCLTGPF